MDSGPTTEEVAALFGRQQDGLSLRDYFAAAALTGLLAAQSVGPRFRDVAADAYLFADAMLAARGAK